MRLKIVDVFTDLRVVAYSLRASSHPFRVVDIEYTFASDEKTPLAYHITVDPILMSLSSWQDVNGYCCGHLSVEFVETIHLSECL